MCVHVCVPVYFSLRLIVTRCLFIIILVVPYWIYRGICLGVGSQETDGIDKIVISSYFLSCQFTDCSIANNINRIKK